MTGHYSVHIGLAPSYLWLDFPEVSLFKICIIARTTAAHFAKHQSLHTLVSIFSVLHHFDFLLKAGISWRVCIVAPHIPHVLYVFIFNCQSTRWPIGLINTQTTFYSKHWFYIHKTAFFQICRHRQIRKNTKKEMGHIPKPLNKRKEQKRKWVKNQKKYI